MATSTPEQLKARKIYTKIWEKRDRDNTYVFYAPNVIRNFIMYALYYSNETRDTIAILRHSLSRSASFWESLPKKIARAFKQRGAPIHGSSKITLFNIQDFRTSARMHGKDVFTGDMRQTAFILLLALGFRIRPSDFSVIRPKKSAVDYFLAIYYDAVVEYKNRVMEVASYTGQDIEVLKFNEALYDPRVVNKVYGEHDLTSFVDIAYAYAFGTAMATNPILICRAGFQGIIHTSPSWFKHGVTGTELRIERITDVSVESALEVCNSERKVREEAYEAKLSDLQRLLDEELENNQNLTNVLTKLQKELDDVRNLTTTDTHKKEVEDVANVIEEANSLAEKSESNLHSAAEEATNMPDSVENTTKTSMLTLAEQLQIGKEKLRPLEKEGGEERGEEGGYVNALARALAERRVFLQFEEGEDEDEVGSWESSSQMASNIIAYEYVPDVIVPIPRRNPLKITPGRYKTRKERSRGKSGKQNKEGTLSPTRQYMGETYDLRPWA